MNEYDDEEDCERDELWRQADDEESEQWESDRLSRAEDMRSEINGSRK